MCVDCGACGRVCPINAEQGRNYPDYLKTYAGYSSDSDVISTCTSGGFATELSKLIINQCTPQDAIIKNIKPNLDLITAGPIPPNPSELLGSKRMKELLEQLSSAYDYILIYTPPLNIVSDALTLVDVSAGLVLIARQKATQYDELQKSVDSMIKVVREDLQGIRVIKALSKNDYENRRYNSRI